MHSKNLLFSLVILFISILTFNCTKIDTTIIGSGLLPAVDNVNTFDTIVNVVSNNIDSFSTDCVKIYPTDDRPLGFISNDPYFGTTNAIIYSEFKPTLFPFNFPTNSSRTLDSVVLVLKYKRTYGDSSKPVKLNVYQLSDVNTKFDSSICSFHDFDVPILGSIIYTPTNLRDTTPLRINLRTTMQGLFSSSTAFVSDSAFKVAFHGFAFAPDVNFSGSNSISYFNLVDTTTKMLVYYKYVDTAGTPPKNALAKFYLSQGGNSFSGNASYVSRLRGNSEIFQHSNGNSSSTGDSVVYIQTSPGSYCQVKMPALTNVSNRIIHRAELIIDQVYSPAPTDTYFSTPNYLFLDIKDSGNNYHLELCDFNFSSQTGPNLSEFGGFRTYAKDYLGRDISRYVFNISRYVQNIITKKASPRTFRLYSPSLVTSGTVLISDALCNSSLISYPLFLLNQPVAGRVKVGGGNSANNRMRLHIIYSRI